MLVALSSNELKETLSTIIGNYFLQGGIIMKKMSMLLTVVALGAIFICTSTVMAGGDKNRGEIGTGNTFENNCPDQPCFEDAPKPGSSATLIMQSAEEISELDATEIMHLEFIREEEKMARDVYRVLYGIWGNPIFANIIESEQNHMDAMANLLAFYGVDDPVISDETGAFKSEAISDYYSDLVARGSASLIDALLVGAEIEEFDILDIWKAYDETDEERIQKVYQNLYEGSYNHLQAFVYVYELVSEISYIPVLFWTEDAYIPKFLEEETEIYDYVMNFETQAGQKQNAKQQRSR